MEKLIKAGHLIRYVKEVDRGAESEPLVNRITADVVTSSETRPTINYILGAASNDQYQLQR